MTNKQKTSRIAIFASGAGSNAAKIIDYFKDSKDVNIELIVSNNKQAGVLAISKDNGIATSILDKRAFYSPSCCLETLDGHEIDFVVLAGFLWKVPLVLIERFAGRMVNIHPSLLPKYGGKGMYGNHVHEAVIANKEAESGITIHYVTEGYDEGAVIFQARCPVMEDDTAETLANRIHQLEHLHFAPVIESLL